MNAKNIDRAIRLPAEMVFGRLIEGIRGYKSMSQSELAAAADLSNAAVSRVERGESNPTLTTVLAIARGLALSPSELMRAFTVAEEGALRRLRAAIQDTADGELPDTTINWWLRERFGGKAAKAAASLVKNFQLGPTDVPIAKLVAMAADSAVKTGIFAALAGFFEPESDDSDTGKKSGAIGHDE
ncbi:MAG: helix-turn-helix domain-containing protein [Planctomycetes bacterium]|nr:helix-turn-helix domain-containing protein [Planctomycetota bacterium]